MLVLSRRIGERLVIDDSITVTVIEVRGGQIRLGIEARRRFPSGARRSWRGRRRWQRNGRRPP